MNCHGCGKPQNYLAVHCMGCGRILCEECRKKGVGHYETCKDGRPKMHWENDGKRLMLGDDELAVITDDPRSGDIRISMTCLGGAKAALTRRLWPIAKVRAEIINRIKQGREPLLSRAREDAALAERIVNADLPKEEAP